MKKIIAAILIMIFCVVGICIVGPLCGQGNETDYWDWDKCEMLTDYCPICWNKMFVEEE